MCMQCAATAATAVGTASGLRAWARSAGGAWLTTRRLRALTAGLMSVAVLAAGIGFG